MSKHPAGLLNFPLKSSLVRVAGSAEEYPGTPLWTSTNKKLERSKSSLSPVGGQDRSGMYLLEAPLTEASRCSSMGILKPEDMSGNFDLEGNSLLGSLDLEKAEKTEEFHLASYLLAPSAALENMNQPFSLDCSEDGTLIEHLGNRKINQTAITESWTQDKPEKDLRLSSFLANSNHPEEKFSSRSTSIGYASCSGLSSSFKLSGTVRDSYGFGNLTFSKDASFCEKMELAMDGELFVSSDSEKKKLIDEAERQHEQMMPDRPENSFVNASASQLEPPAMLSQSTYFQLSTSRLGSLEIDDVQRPKSEELRPGLGFNRIVSPKNRPFRVIQGSPRDVGDPVVTQNLNEQKLRTSNAFKNLEGSFLESSNDQKYTKDELMAILVKGRKNPQELAKILYPNRSGNDEVFEQLISHLGLNNNTKKDKDFNEYNKQGTQLLPSFLEATVPQAAELVVPSSEKDLPHRLSPGYAGKSRIPRLSPKEKSSNPEKIVRHSSPMKKQKLNNGNEFKTPNVPTQEAPLALPVTSDRNSLVWLANPTGSEQIKIVTIKNMLNDQNLPLTLSIRESNCFKFADSRSVTHAIVVNPGGTFEIRVAFLPTRPGWSMARLGIKRTQNVKGPALKAVVKLVGHCGQPNIVMEKCGMSCSIKDIGDWDLGCMTKDFSDEFSFKNEGDAAGFIKLQVFDNSNQTCESNLIGVTPSHFVVKPGEVQQIRFKVSRNDFSPGDYFQSTLVIYQGSEVLRQGWRSKIGASKPKNVELSEVFDREDLVEEIKLLKTLQVDDQVGFQFFKSTSKTVTSLTGSCAPNQPSFFSLPMEETMNESQMLSQTFSSTSMLVSRPETIMEEGPGSCSETKIPKGNMSLVRTDPEVVFFPPTVVGGSRQWKIKVKNGSTSLLDFKLSGLTQPFAVTNKVIQVKPMSCLSLSVSYQPVSHGTHEGTLTLIGTNNCVLKVSLRGSTTKSAVLRK